MGAAPDEYARQHRVSHKRASVRCRQKARAEYDAGRKHQKARQFAQVVRGYPNLHEVCTGLARNHQQNAETEAGADQQPVIHLPKALEKRFAPAKRSKSMQANEQCQA